MSYEDIRSLEEQLDDLCLTLDKQIATASIEADKIEIDPVELRSMDGGWVLAPLLAAKAQALYALVLVKGGLSGSTVNIYNGPDDSAGGPTDAP